MSHVVRGRLFNSFAIGIYHLKMLVVKDKYS